ncbi:MAG: helix-turn-helix domain-containing protein [Spirochaetota bacterium]|nr:helix-turn-helix domain-containing protein [Spirochaetota bacterium]
MIPFISIPPLLMATIAVYVAVSYTLMFARRKNEPEHIWFALMCYTIALYDIFSALLYMSPSPLHSILYQRMQFAVLACFIIAITWFIASLVHINSALVYTITLIMGLFIIAGFVFDSSYTLNPYNPYIKQFHFFGTTITYNEADPGLVYVLQYIAMLITGLYLLYKLFIWCRYGEIHIKILFISFSIFLLASINDVCVGKGMYQFIYILEYAYFFVILSMAYILQSRFVKLHREIEHLTFLFNRKLLEKERYLQPISSESKHKQLSATNSEKIQHAVEYIHANFAFDLSREGLAAMIDLHPDTFSRLFKTYTGKSLPDYINELRINYARELLTSTSDSIVTIAFKTGFESLSTFNRAFHKILNTTPTAYRKHNSKF